jgi:hypothetical protein
MSTYKADHDPRRREFLRTAALTTAAAVASGAGVAALSRQAATAPTVMTVAPTTAVSPAIPLLSNPDDIADLFTRLTAAQAENVRLQAELDAARRDLSAFSQSQGGQTSQLETLSMQLEGANQQIGLLAGLVALYEQMDGVDVAALLAGGVTAVADSLNTLAGKAPTLAEGIAISQRALAELDEQIPLLQNGRGWLASQQSKLDGYFAVLEERLRGAVEKVGPFLEMVNEWFQDMRKWLPFNLGERAANIMEAATTLLSETPHTISGLNTNIAGPLDLLLSKDEGDEVRLRHRLIKPLREQLISPVQAFAEETGQVKLAFQEKVAGPWETAVAQRQQLQAQIAQYRQENQV